MGGYVGSNPTPFTKKRYSMKKKPNNIGKPDENKPMFYIDGEPEVVTEARKKILEAFGDLTFYPEPHKYFFPDWSELPSVSSITHRFEPHTDYDVVAENYAIKNGRTKEYWLDEWKHNNLVATTTGTLVHSYGENLAYVWNGHPEFLTEECKGKYVKEKNWLIPTRGKEKAILKFQKELHKDLHLVLPETKVYTGKNKELTNIKQDYCGTFDILYYYDCKEDPKKSGFVLMDFKTNKDIYKQFSRDHNKMALPPFNNMYDEPFTYYTLQLSAYTIPLEDIGLKVIARRIIWLKDDGTYEIIPTESHTSTLRQIL